MAMKITREILESHLNCKFKGHLQLAGESGTKSDYEAMTEAASRASREAALAKLAAGCGHRGEALTAAILKLFFRTATRSNPLTMSELNASAQGAGSPPQLFWPLTRENTWMAMMLASRATPEKLAPLPAAIPATCVP